LAAGVCRADTKKDVSDPVLQEILDSFKTKTPRFINKHGNTLFVEDEPVTRGSFISALYEYDKSLKAAQKSDLTAKPEMDVLKQRLSALEKKAETVEAPKPEIPAKLDITQIINELKPNMPFLLDGTLNSSKVFSELKNKVLAEPAAALAPAAIPAPGMDKSAIDAVNARVAQLESGLTDLRARTSKQQASEVSQAPRADTEALAVRLKKLETSISTMKPPEPQQKNDQATAESIGKINERVLKLEKTAASPALQKPQADQVSAEAIERINQRVVKLETKRPAIDQTTAENIEKLNERIAKLEKLPGSPVVQKIQPVTAETASKSEVDNMGSRLATMERNLLLVSNKLDAQGSASDNIEKNVMADLRSRLDKLEANPSGRAQAPSSQAASTEGPSKKELGDITNRLSIIEKDIYVNDQKQIEDILKRMDKIESAELIGYKDSAQDPQVSVKKLVTKQEIEELESRIAFLEKDVYVNLKNDLKDSKDKIEEVLKELRAVKINLEKR
jgi:hypothetical protein